MVPSARKAALRMGLTECIARAAPPQGCLPRLRRGDPRGMAGGPRANPAALVYTKLFMVGWRRTDFRPCARKRATLVFATAPRETFERVGTGRKAGTSAQEAIRRGHFI